MPREYKHWTQNISHAPFLDSLGSVTLNKNSCMCCYKEPNEPGVVLHICNPSTGEVEASRRRLQDHPQLHSGAEASQRFLSQSNTNRKKNLQKESKEGSAIVIKVAAEFSGAASCEVSQILQQEKGEKGTTEKRWDTHTSLSAEVTKLSTYTCDMKQEKVHS